MRINCLSKPGMITSVLQTLNGKLLFNNHQNCTNKLSSKLTVSIILKHWVETDENICFAKTRHNTSIITDFE